MSVALAAGLLVACIPSRMAPQDGASEPQIVGGQPVTPDNPGYGNAVSISRDGRPICTGSLIAENIVLTAAHCLNTAGNFQIFFGERLDTNEAGKLRKVIRFGRMKPEKFAVFFDLAWMEFEGAPEPGYKPLPLLLDPAELKPGREVVHVGYGKTGTFCEYDGPLDDCIGTRLSLTSRIKEFLSTVRVRHMLITQAAQGKGGVCMGDSGGPVYLRTKKGWHIAAVVNGLDYRLNPRAYETGAARCEGGQASFTFAGFDVGWLEQDTGTDLTQGRPVASAEEYQRGIPRLEQNRQIWKNHAGDAAAFLQACLTGEVGSEAWFTYERILSQTGSLLCEDAWKALQNRPRINLRQEQLVDLSPLSHLNFLQTLDLAQNNLENIDAVGGMKSLTELDLSQNKGLTDLSPLAGADQLRTLDVSGTSVSSLDPVCSAPLERLALRSAGSFLADLIEEASPCFAQTLRELDLSGSGLTALPPTLNDFQKVEKLFLGHNKLTGVEGLPSAVRDLTLDRNPIESYRGLSELRSLGSLSLRSVSLSLGELPSLPALHTLAASGGAVASLEFANRLSALKNLSLADIPAAAGKDEPASDAYLLPLSKTRSLETFVCEECQLPSIRNLIAVSTLKTLHLRGNSSLRSVSGLERLARLESLSVRGAPLFAAEDQTRTERNKETMRKLRSLVELNVSLTGLDEISFVTYLPGLKVFHAGFNKIVDLSPMASLRNLEFSELSQNPATNLGPLAGLKSMKVLRFYFYSGSNKVCPLTGPDALCEFYPELRLRPLEFPQP